ncbi:hypothetical protein F3Y22_tig00111402pilonHSYRG00027 [Hibiscus syriacus]|uniref:Nicotianamine synthase n=1 Tax=Hibiscus syriacus TaxID=106335 RepID=A0A6A2XT25_HIBSY|nr:hypothetical protein F3Y22_tig00111402pilonHSYRG00027 [Hibiscus syriacus]
MTDTSSSSILARNVMTNVRFAVEIFYGTGHFGMWQSEVLDALFQQGLDIAIEGEKPDDIEEKEWKMINRMTCTTMNDHITSINQLMIDLMNMDVTFEDEDLALMLMGSLPDEFEYLETTLLHGKVDVSLSEVIVALYSHELRKKDKQENTSVEEETLVVRGRSKSQNKGSRGRSKSKSRLSKDEYSDFAFAATPSTSCSSSWLLDSACSHHMTPNREWFFDFKELKSGIVYTANNSPLDTLGIGSIRLRNQDGSIRTLTGVHYVPNLMRNLISMGTLESKGLEVRAKDEIMMIISGALVIMKGIRERNNVYYFMGSTIVGTAAVATSTDEHEHFTVRGTPQQNGGGRAYEPDISGEDYDSLHVFGSTAYYHVKESKLDPRAKNAIFMGITSGVKGYRLWCPETKKIIFSRDVIFDESTMLRKVTSEKLDQTDGTPKQVEFEGSKIVPTSKETDVDSPMVEEESDEEEVQTQEPPQQHESIALRKGKRTIRQPARYADMVSFASPITIDDVPATFNEAVQSSEHKKWRIAMNEEMQSLQKNQTWKLASLPKGKKAIGCKWVYAKKDGFPDKNNIRYKARLVAKGYAQTEGVDYNEVFSPVVKHSSIIILLALVAQLDLELVQMGVKTAFLHGDLDEEIYMTQPDGFKVVEKEEIVCKLEKSLYGLKQSPRQWSQTEIAKLKTQLNREFEMKDLGEAKKILGMEISRDKKLGMLCLSQKEYLRKVLKRFGINEMSKLVSTPLTPHFKIGASISPKDDAEREYKSKVPYASVVGSLMYAMVCTRPDISQAVGVVSRYIHDPGKEHWQAVKWIMRYILNTVDVGLVFQQDKQDGQCVVGYCDSDYAGDLDKRRSTNGYVFTSAKAPVSWKSTLQSTVALSTTEAKYMAVTEAVKEAIWLQGLLGELEMEQKHIKVHCDSQSAIHLAKNQVYHARTKHIDVRYHFVREILEEGGVIIQKIRITKNPADMLTKVFCLRKVGFKRDHCDPSSFLGIYLEASLHLTTTTFHNYDIDPSSNTKVVLLVSSNPNLSRRMSFHTADIMGVTDALRDYDVVFLAALVRMDMEAKAQVVDYLAKYMAPGALLTLRSAHGARAFLYPVVDPCDLRGFEVLSVFHPYFHLISL